MIDRFVVLASGSGTNLQVLLDHPVLAPRLIGVVSDRAGAGAVDRAAARGVGTTVVAPADHPDRAAWDSALVDGVAAYDPGAVVLAGFMRIIGPDFVNRWPVVNVHPSILPAFPGAHAVREALDWGVTLTGCTVHLVDEQVDHGPVVAQEAVAVLPDDDESALHARIQAVEHRLLPESVAALCEGRLVVEGRRVRHLGPGEPPRPLGWPV